jgi:hypothetical protein
MGRQRAVGPCRGYAGKWTCVEEAMTGKREPDNQTHQEKSAAREESANLKAEMAALLRGSKFQHSVNDEEFFRPNGRYRITIRDLSKEELHEIVSAVAALNLVSKRIQARRPTRAAR